MAESTVAVEQEEQLENEVDKEIEKASAQNRRYLRPREIFAFLLTAFGQKNLTQFVNATRQFFMISFLGLSGSAYGTIIFIETLYDALDDSLSGLIIDRTRTRWGKMRPYLLLSTPVWAIAIMMLFTTPSFLESNTQKIIWAVIAIFAHNLGMSYFGVFNILLYDVTPNINERNNLIASQKFMELVIRERVPLASREQMKEVSIWQSIKIAFKNRPMLVLQLNYFFNGFKSVGSSSESFFWQHNAGKLSYGTIAGIFTGIPNYFMVPLAPKLIRKFGARNTGIMAGIFGGVAYTVLFFIGYKPFGEWDSGEHIVLNLVAITLMLTICGLSTLSARFYRATFTTTASGNTACVTKR